LHWVDVTNTDTIRKTGNPSFASPHNGPYTGPRVNRGTEGDPSRIIPTGSIRVILLRHFYLISAVGTPIYWTIPLRRGA